MRAARRVLLAAVLGVATFIGVPGAARADGRAEIEKARAAYLARNYAEGETRLRALVDPKTGLKEPGLVTQARMYLGAVLLAQGHRDQATELFEKLILEDPAFEPDPLSFPGDVINTFFDVRAQLQERIRSAAQNAARLEAERRVKAEDERRRQEAWLANVKRLAQEEKITVRNSRLVALLPFGAGQFQNGDKILGWTLLASEASLVVGMGVTVPLFAYAQDRAGEEQRAGDLDRKAQLYKDRAENIRIVNLSFAGALLAIAVSGIVQANLAYVPETMETKKRPLPPLSRLSPIVAPIARTDGSAMPSGLFFGVAGTTF